MPSPTRYALGRSLQVLGMGVVLLGLLFSMSLGFQDEGLASMKYEFYALGGGGVAFLVGRWLQGGSTD